MLDFVKIENLRKKIDGVDTVYLHPTFVISGHVKDLITSGHAFEAAYDEHSGYWVTGLDALASLIDRNTIEYAEDRYGSDWENEVRIARASDYSSHIMVDFDTYVKKTRGDTDISENILNKRILYANDEPKREDHATFKLPYLLSDAPTPGWDELIGTLYSPLERMKLEWFIGAIGSNNFMSIDKFAAIHGMPGTGKSTVFDLIEGMFDGYWDTINMEALASPAKDSFAAASISSNPIIGIQDDGDLRHVNGNTLINSIASHKSVLINQKYKTGYSIVPRTVMFVGTNYDVRIEGDDGGIYRRLINIETSEEKIEFDRYLTLMQTIIPSEYGGIVKHCIDEFHRLGGADAYRDYRAVAMRESTDPFMGFLLEYDEFLTENDPVTLKQLWRAFKDYCEDAGYPRVIGSMSTFKERMYKYYHKYSSKTYHDNVQYRSLYSGYNRLKANPDMVVVDSGEATVFSNLPKVLQEKYKGAKVKIDENRLDLRENKSKLDIFLKDCPAQYATAEGTPQRKWDEVRTTLSQIDTTKLHYVLPPKNFIVIDLDLKNKNGEKDALMNLTRAAMFPETYTEFSQGGKGVHLHYIYDGDPALLSRMIEPNVEVKVFTGKASLRRRLTFCNDKEVAHLAGGYLPLRKEKSKVVDSVTFKNEKHLRSTIVKIMKEKSGGGTAPAVKLIGKVLSDAYSQGIHYDLTDMRQDVENFACQSSHHASECYKACLDFKWRSEDISKTSEAQYVDDRIVFFDIEIFPNLFLVNWKYQNDGEWHWNDDKSQWIFEGKKASCVSMINPTANEIEELCKHKLVGFNNLRYDNLILYARMSGYSIQELYQMSNQIINGDRGRQNYSFHEAKNVSYTDIYDFASAGHKKSLKKWEIQLGLHHDELEYPWNKPVPEEDWTRVAEYCNNDVISTEAVFAYLHGDFEAREMLAAITGLTVNDTTNTLTKAFIFGDDKKPDLVYTDFTTGLSTYADGTVVKCKYPNKFAQYEYKQGHNLYHRKDGKVVDLGRGGYVAANPGVYGNALTLDVASMHPHSIMAMNMFGKYTERFGDIMQARIAIKHGDFEAAKKMFDGALSPYLKSKEDAKTVSNALKTAINSVYGLTSASFDNPFRDARNVNNIVALRGALFMATLQEEVEAKGFTVIHIKTDSIKIANPTKDILDYCIKRGKEYGYDFETEAIWDKIALVNKSVIIGHQTADSPQAPGEWVAVGKQFQRPYVYKTLFTHEPIKFEDCCETKEVKSPYAIYILKEDGTTKYIGRNGLFTPVKKNVSGSGELVKPKRNGGEGWDAVAETKGYLWAESEILRGMTDPMQYVDQSYYTELCNQAIESIEQFGNFEAFVDLTSDEDIPFVMPCGDVKMESCLNCPHFSTKHQLCQLGFDISDILLRESKNGNI